MNQDKLAARLAKVIAQQEKNEARHREAAQRAKKLREAGKDLDSMRANLECRIRNHRLIETGALVEKILGTSVDKGILAGLLHQNRELFTGNGVAGEVKLAGDRLITGWEAEKKAVRKAAATEQGEDGNTQ